MSETEAHDSVQQVSDLSSLPFQADLFLYGGRVLTLDPTRPVAEAVAVSSRRIFAVGAERELRALTTSSTQFLSCNGGTVLPGFIDPHLHLFAWASRFCGVDLSAAHSLPEIRALLAQRLPRLAPGEWLRGYGYDEFFLVEKRPPTRSDLDQVSTTHPLILRHRTGHAAVLNSVALQRAGIDRHLSPPTGGHVEHDPLTGEPTGVVYELEGFLRTAIPPLPEHDFRAGVTQASAALLRQGVCSFHDTSAGNTLEDVALFRRLHDEGVLRSRATVMVGIDAFPQLLNADLRPFDGDAWVRLGSVKIMVHESRGVLYPPPETLAAMVWRVHSHGFQVAIHAVEEAAICAAIDAITQAQERLPGMDHRHRRHRIEHCALCPLPFIEQLRATGTAVVTQPGFVYFYGDKYASEIDPALHEWLYRTKSLMESGVPVAGSSDCPIAPLSPLRGIQAAMSRRSQSGITLNPQERCDLHQALTLYTSAGAWMGFEEEQKGRIMPGMFADLVVLDGDMRAVAVEDIHTLKVTTTIIGGEIVWSI